MRIGIDCRSILHPEAGESAGVGHYVHGLVSALLQEHDKDARHEYVLFFDNHDAAQAKRELIAGRKGVTARVLPFRTFRRALPFVYSHLVVAAVFEREKLDLLHGPANVVPLFYRRSWVVTVHDLAIYDHLEWFPPGSLGTQRFSTAVLVPHSVEHARRVIVPSQTTANDVKRLFEVDASRIDVIPEGVDAQEGRARVRADAPLFLFVGTIEPRKNIASAVRAFAEAVTRGWLPSDARFVIAGRRGWKDHDVFTAIARANAALGSEAVTYVGYVSAKEKRRLFAEAAAFVFPSLYEGFGLPALEAMAQGTPVIASDTPALVETCGGAAVHVPATDVLALAAAMRDMLRQPEAAARLREAGLARAASLTWAAAAKATLRTYEKAGGATIDADGHDTA